jgi:hypothetical protein
MFLESFVEKFLSHKRRANKKTLIAIMLMTKNFKSL